MTTPPSDDNPFRTPDFAGPPAPMPGGPVPGGPMPGGPMPGAPGRAPVPHWFTPKVRLTLVACVVAALALGALGALGISWIGRSGPPSEGDCLYLSRESGGKLAYHRVGCAEDRATYTVDRSYHSTISCGTGDYVRFRISGTGSGTSGDRTLCLALNVDFGDCLRDVDDDATIAKVSCTDPAARQRARVVPGLGGEDECVDAEKVLVYPGPPRRTVCLVKAGETI